MPTIADRIVSAVMQFMPDTVPYMKVTSMDYRSSKRSIQVVDLRGGPHRYP